MNEREQIITFLLQAVDAKNSVIVELQKKIAEMEKAVTPIVCSAPSEKPTS